MLTIKQARQIAGRLGYPTKMPGTSYGLPAERCVTGAKLAKVPGSICSTCYALGGNAGYQFGRARTGLYRRLEAIKSPLWVEAMVTLLRHEHAKERIRVDLGAKRVRNKAWGGPICQWNEPGFHRWHDSGDLQSVEHFGKICEVARRTPHIKHWLPTQELQMVLAYKGVIPSNLLIRVSSVMVDDHIRRSWPHTSSVYRFLKPEDAHICPAPQQDHRCGSCRACWSNRVEHVAYKWHSSRGKKDDAA